MKILMIAPEPFFEPRGTPFSVLGRLKALSHLGHEVDLLTYHVGQNVVIPGVAIFRIPAFRFIQEIPIGPSWMKLFLDILLFAKAFHLLLRKRYDLLHTHEEASFFGILISKLFGIQHLYDMHSSLPQQLSNFRYTRFRPLIRLFEWLEHRVINSSDAIITICPALEEYVKKINGYVRHVMIENVAIEGDPATVSEVDLIKFRTAHSLDGKRIILYTGTFEPYQGLDLLIASAEQVLQQHKEIVFLLVGGRPGQVQHYQSRVQDLGLSPYFTFTGARPMDEMAQFIGMAYILVSPRVSGTNTPLKIYSYLKSGKPIVATNILAHTQVLNSNIAILTEPFPEAFGQGIVRVLQNEDFANGIGQSARQTAEEKFGVEMFIEKTRYIFDRVGGTR